MTKQEIIKALSEGLNVYWSNTSYKVTLGKDKESLYVTYSDNEYMTGLQDSELSDCFTGEYMSLDSFVRMYMDYVNNFLTIESFAEHYRMPVNTAKLIVDTGYRINQTFIKRT